MNKNRPPRLRWQAAGLVLLAVLGSCEAAARLEDLVRWGIPPGHPATRRGDIVVTSPDGRHGRPGARVQGWQMNRHGTRGPDFEIPKPAGTWRLLVAGASEAFGLTETPGREFARQLEDSLRANCAGGRLEVVNAAVPGMTLPTVVQDLGGRAARFDPDLVLYLTTPAQYLADSLPVPANPSTGLEPLSRWRSRAWPRTAAALREVIPGPIAAWARDRAWRQAGRRRGPGWRFESVPTDRLAAYEAELRRLVGTARRAGASVVLMPHANALTGLVASGQSTLLSAWRRSVPRATGPVLLAFDSVAGDAARRVAADSGAGWIDPRPVLAADPAAHFADFAHFTDLGAARLAGAVRRGLPPIPGC